MSHGTFYKILKFGRGDKNYTLIPEFFPENETYKIIYGFEIQTDHSILARRPDPVLIIKKKTTFHIRDIVILAEQIS